IFYFLLMALKNKSVRFLHISTALCAISTNLKADSIVMGLPIFLTYLLAHLYTGFAFRKFAFASFVAVGVFLGTLVLTNMDLAIRPQTTIKNQMQLLFYVGSGQGVKLKKNVELFGEFLHQNLVSPFLAGVSGKTGWKWVFLSVGLGVTGLCVAFARSP